MKKYVEWAAAIAAACALVSSRASAQDTACGRTITRENIAACARARSFAVRMAREEVRAAEGRRVSATPILPSNPVIAGNAARREGGEDGPAVINWQASIGQEIEIGGQRGARVRAAEEGVAGQRERLRLAEQSAITAAWTAYFETIAAREEDALAREIAASAAAFVRVASARAEKGVASLLEADLARVAAVRAEQARIEAARTVVASRADLAAVLAIESPTIEVDGSLEPIPLPARPDLEDTRPELRAAEADARYGDARAAALRRERVPNPTVSLFGGREELNRTYYGVGLSLPLPLPEPLGRSHAGEIAEAEALSARARIDVARWHDAMKREALAARATFAARQDAAALFQPEDLRRARASLTAIADEVTAGRMSVRDAVVAQQALLELLRGDVAARRALCIASVELARVTGAFGEGGSR